MLGHEQQRPVRRRPSLRVRSASSPQERPVRRDLRRVAPRSEQPGIADLGGDHRQVGHHGARRQRSGEGIERGALHPSTWVPGSQFGVCGHHLVGGRWPGVVPGVEERQHVGAARHRHVPAVAPGLVRHHHLGTVRGSPPEHRGHLGHGPRRVHPEVQEGDAGLVQERDEPPRVAGHVGHLRRRGQPVEALVEPSADRQAPTRQVRVEQLGVGGHGERVPGHVAGAHGIDQTGDLGVERLLEDPRAGGPHQPFGAASLAQLRRRGDRRRDVLVHVARHHLVGEAGEAEVEVRLGHHVDGAD